jgi:hypothetical protein
LFEALMPLQPKAKTGVEFYRWAAALIAKAGR